MLLQNKIIRYLSGVLILGIIIAALFYSQILLLVSALFIIISMIEYRNMFKERNIFPHIIIPEITGIILAYIFINGGNETAVLIAGCFLAFFSTVVFDKKPYIYTSFSTIAAILFIFCGLYIIKLSLTYSVLFVIIYFISVLAGDFAASKIGPAIPSFRIAPEISPNKTVAGAIACIIATTLVCLLYNVFLSLSIYKCILMGLVTSLFAQIGDLTVSSIKRDLRIKHSGSLFADYGGIWDRIDAFIFSAPALYYTLLLLS